MTVMAQKSIKTALLWLSGWLSLITGLIGIVLPLLPTTPFVLLSAYCFARTSPRLHHWMLNHRWFGPPIRQWQQTGTVNRESKIKALFLIAVTFLLTLTLTPIPAAAKAALVLLALILMGIVARLPEQRKIRPQRELKGSQALEKE
jgi:uncharacterized membrane protein YbaN (DUF454 family)